MVVGFLMLLGFFILYFGGSALLQKKYHIPEESDTRRWRLSKNKYVILFSICWFIIITILVLKGTLNQLNALLALYIPREIWEGIKQYRNNKENRTYILIFWQSLSLIIFFVAFTVYSSLVK
jgi:MFS family permease